MKSKFILPIFLLILSSCDLSPTLDDKLQSYIDGLNRYEGLSIEPTSQRFPILMFPSIKYRTQLLTVFDVSLIDFLSLQHCSIGYLAGEKNSVLGKVMTHSQRLVYETNIIRGIESCNIESQKLKEELYNIAQIKRVELSKAFSNSVWGGEEAQRFFSFSNGHLPMTVQPFNFQALESSLSDLNTLAAQLQMLPNLNDNRLEKNFKIIYYSEYGGQFILTLLRLTDAFNSVSNELNTLKINTNFCRGPIVFLKQQFKTQYIEQLQPYMAKINSTAYRLLGLITELQKSSGAISLEMNAFLDQFSLTARTGVWRRYQAASQRHAKEWDRLLRECNAF